jgi:hypothetical protein
VVSGGSVGAILFGNSGTLELDSPMAFGGTISGFQLGDEIDLRGLAFTSGTTSLSWTQLTSGANASGIRIMSDSIRAGAFFLRRTAVPTGPSSIAWTL